MNMNHDETAHTDFGCEQCWPANPDDAWEGYWALAKETDLIDESHYHVMLLACESCSQRFVSVFTETIDWIDGDDSMYSTVLPVTALEADELTQQPALVIESQIYKLWPKRRSLRNDRPKGTTERSYWSVGL